MEKNPDKLIRKAIREEQKRIKPGECQKYIRMVLDSSIANAGLPLGPKLLDALNGSPIKYQVRDLPKRNCIVWERNPQQRKITANELTDEWELEEMIFMFMKVQELQDAITSKTLDNIGKDLRAAFPNKRYTLILLRDPSKKPKNDAIGAILVELQVLQEMTTLEIPPNIKEIVAMLQRYTKAIAEIPFKQQKTDLTKGFKKYFLNDKKDCVRIVGDSGYDRLWRQQLTRLPLLTLARAETIAAEYSCPKKLIDAFENDPTAITKLANLKVKHNATGAEQKERRIGQVMASKLYKLYTSRDPNEVL